MTQTESEYDLLLYFTRSRSHLYCIVHAHAYIDIYACPLNETHLVQINSHVSRTETCLKRVVHCLESRRPHYSLTRPRRAGATALTGFALLHLS